MDDINPFEHPPLYEVSQVITEDDLKFLEKMYQEHELTLAQAGYMREAVECRHVHLLMERLKEWIRDGKPKGDFEHEPPTPDS